MDPTDQRAYLSPFDRGFGRLAVLMYDHRRLVWVLTALLLGVAAYFATKPRPDNSFDAFFNASDPVYQSYLAYDDEFGSDEVIYILYAAPDRAQGPFDTGVMEQVDLLTRTLETELPFVDEVTSLSNVEFITADDDFLEINELGLALPITTTEMRQWREAMMAKPAYRNSLIDDAAAHGALVVEMSVTSSDPWDALRFDPTGGEGLQNFYPQVPQHQLEAILARPEFAGIQFWVTGDVPMNTAYNEVIGTEVGLLVGTTILLAGLLSLMNFRFQLLGLLGPLGVIVASLILMVGFMGLMGYDLGVLFLIAPNMLIAIAVAQSVHLITEFKLMQGAGHDRREAIRLAFEHAAVPCLLAALTTALGIVVMAGSQLRSLSEMSVYLGVGVALAFVGSITVMASLMSIGSVGAAAPTGRFNDSRLQGLLTAISNINTQRHNTVLLISAVVVVLSLIGVAQLRIAFNFKDDFKETVAFRVDTDYISEVMGGMLNVAVIYDTGETDGIKRADVLQHMATLQALADQDEIVKKSLSLVDVVKDLNQSLHGDAAEFYALPTQSDLISQYLLLYEISGGRELSDYVSTDFRRTTLELRLAFAESDRIAELINRLKAHIAANPLPGVEIQFTGIGLLWVTMADYIASSQLQGYSLAFVMIALVLCVAFRSIKVGLVAMIPNLFPIVLVMGLMGWFDIHLDYLRLLLATIAIGIAVDDTVHIVARMRKEFNRCGRYEDAMRATLTSVGRALLITTIVLTVSFSVFHLSDMAVLASFGTLLSITMVVALIGDLFLLPVLICRLRVFGPERMMTPTS